MKTVLLTLILSSFMFEQLHDSNMQCVSLAELLGATGGEPVGFDDGDVAFSRVGIDSRTVRAGELFWAIEGERHDGHAFVTEAFQNGATACVVQAGKTSGVAGPRIVVPNTLEALWKFARRHRDSHDALIIGVTGSVGKTTTREMIHATLKAGFTGTRSPQNFNNHFGVPLSILEINRQHEFAVLELAASHVGEIRDLCALAAPEIGVVTRIGLAHLAEFGSIENIIGAKGELVEALPKSGFAVLAGDDPHVRLLAERAQCPVIFVGEGPENDLRATHIELETNRLTFNAVGTRFEVSCVGRHHVTAALTAIAIGREIGMNISAIAQGLKSFTPVSGRCRREEVGPWTAIDDTYNASPCSMRAACDVLQSTAAAGKKLLLAGDMLELGDRADELHLEVGKVAGNMGIDLLMAIGDHAEHFVRGALEAGMEPHRLAQCENLDLVLTLLDCWLEPGDVVLVKGSRAMRMERVVEWLRSQAERNFNENWSRRSRRACA